MTAYQDFLANGGKDADWEAYRAKCNDIACATSRARVLHNYLNDIFVPGNDIANILRDDSIAVPEKIARILQHEDTRISRSSVEARGLSRASARIFVLRVSNLVLRIYPGHSILESDL